MQIGSHFKEQNKNYTIILKICLREHYPLLSTPLNLGQKQLQAQLFKIQFNKRTLAQKISLFIIFGIYRNNIQGKEIVILRKKKHESALSPRIIKKIYEQQFQHLVVSVKRFSNFSLKKEFKLTNSSIISAMKLHIDFKILRFVFYIYNIEICDEHQRANMQLFLSPRLFIDTIIQEINLLMGTHFLSLSKARQTLQIIFLKNNQIFVDILKFQLAISSPIILQMREMQN